MCGWQWHLHDWQRFSGGVEELKGYAFAAPSHAWPARSHVRGPRPLVRCCAAKRFRDAPRSAQEVSSQRHARKPRRGASDDDAAPASVQEDGNAFTAVSLEREARTSQRVERLTELRHEDLAEGNSAVQGLGHDRKVTADLQVCTSLAAAP